MNIYRNLLIALLVLGLAAPALTACGTDDSGNEDLVAENNDEEQENDEPEQGVTDAAHVLIEVSPTRFSYAVGTKITPRATVYDATWDELGDAEVQWQLSPSERVEAQGSQWEVIAAGTITIEACALDDQGQATSVCGEKQIISAHGTDRIVLQSPTPGQHFHGDEHALIPVEGYVDDALEVDSVNINGQNVPVDDQGRFVHDVEPIFGVNTIAVRAFDGVNSEDAIAAASVMWAPHYVETFADNESGQLGLDIEQAILLSLGQNFLDDGEPYTVISESQVVTKDLADILMLVLEHVDITSQIPNPVVDSSALVLSIPDVSINEPRVEIFATDSGIEIFAQIGDLLAETAGYLELSDATLDLSGDISAALSLFASIDVEKNALDEPFHVEMVDFELAIEHATPNFESEEANAVFELADSALRDNLETILLDGVDLSFIDALPDMLLDLFQSLDEVIAGQEFELDLDLGHPLTLYFDGGIGKFTPVHAQGLHGHITASLRVDESPVFPNNPGVAHVRVDPDQSPLFSSSRVQLGLNLALINGILHSLWNAGLLDLNITELVPSSLSGFIEEGQATGLLPPVAAPPEDDSPHDILLRLGQLELEMDWLDQQDRFGAALMVGADLTVIGDQVSITIADEPQIDLWLIESSEHEPLMSATELRNLIRSSLWPEIQEGIGEGLGFALPIPGVDSLATYAPALSEMTLDVRMTRAMAFRQGFLMLDATIEGELFLP